MEFTIKEFKEFGLSPGAYIYLYGIVTNDEDILLNRTIYIISELQENGYIKAVDSDLNFVLRQKTIGLQNKLNPETQFEQFWDKYHEVTGLRKSDKDAAEKYWKKLKKNEKQKAFENISNYYDSLPIYSTGKPVKKARTYLGDKNFNDEFEVIQTKNSLNKMI